jgi:DNA-binding transcriptional LysR family regulator
MADLTTSSLRTAPATSAGLDGVDLRLMRYFLAVVDEQHFGRAAKRLHMSQPPLSQAIRRLEEQLGVELLDRNSRPISPTASGRAFAEAARQTMASVQVAVAEAQRAVAPSLLRIGSFLHLPAGPLHRFLSAITEQGLASETRLTRIPSPEQIRRLHLGELDLGIFPYAEDHEGIELEPLFPGEPLAVFVSSGHRLAREGPIEPEDLRGETLVGFRSGNAALHDRWLARLRDAGYPLNEVRDTAANDGRDLLLAVADGSGVAIMVRSVLETSQAGSLVVRRELAVPVSLSDTVLAWRSDPPRELRSVLAGARQVARQLYRADCPGTEALKAA